MIPTSSAEQVLQTLAGFKESAAGTLMVLELAGTFVFALRGAAAGVKYRLALVGVVTGIGCGMLRDVLVSDIPAVLRSDLYAVAALAGAIIVVAGHVLNAPPAASALAGATVCFGIRLIALWRGWQLPTAGGKK